MSGVVCAKIILCGADAQAGLRAITDIGVLRATADYDDDPLTPEEFADIVEFLDMVEEKGHALAKEIGKL